MSDSNEEPYATIFASLKHPIRRKILRMLSKNTMSFSEMLEALNVSSSFLTYHLENLGELILKTDDGRYKLSSFGEAALATMTKVEDIPATAHLRFTDSTKTVRRPTAIALGIICIVLVAGLVGGFGYFIMTINDKDNTISSLNTQISSKNSQISQLNSNLTNLQNQVNDLTNALNLAKTVKAFNETIIINADGSKSPSTAPIYTADNVTYTLTNNVTVNGDGIGIERDNIILDGAGCTVTGSGLWASGYIGSGITLTGISKVTIRNMTITNFSIGIGLEFAPDFPTASTGNRSAYNTLLGNNITNNRVGIELASGSNNNALLGNNVSANQIGIFLFRVENNTLSGNTVANSGEGITLSFSSYNTIYHNNFINNTSQVHVIAFTDNIWDDGSKGNYWSDYLTKYPNATQVDSSGVWNTPYVIDDLNDTDHYPLMTQDLVPEFPSFLILPLFLTATPLTAMICRKRQTRTT